jgi:hypothetical protein
MKIDFFNFNYNIAILLINLINFQKNDPSQHQLKLKEFQRLSFLSFAN